MATELESIVARLKANTAEMRRGFENMAKKAKDVANSMSSSFERAGKRMQAIGQKMFAAITLPITGITAFSVKAASDVQELMNLIGVTFEDNTDSVIQWANETSRAVQRSRYDLLAAAGDFASFLKPLGIAPEQIKPMSLALSQLTTDIASFRNKTDDEVLLRLFSGMAGETEAVRRLGIDIGQTAVEAEMLSMGFEGNFQTATQAQKAVARYNLIMRQTTDAQSDAIRTALSFENQWKGLTSVLRDVRVAIGSHLLPIATEMVARVRSLGQQFLALSEPAQRTALMIAGIAAALGPGVIVMGTMIRLVGFAVGGFTMLGSVGVKSVMFLGRAVKTVFMGSISAITAFVGYVGAIPAAMSAAIAATIATMLLFPATMKEIFSMEALGAILDNFSVAFYNKVVAPATIMINDLIGAINRIPGISIELLELPGQKEISDKSKEFASNLSGVFRSELGRVKGQITGALSGITDGVMDLLPESVKSALSQIKDIDFDFGESINIDGASQDMDEFLQKYQALFEGMDGFGSAVNETLDSGIMKASDLADEMREAFIGRLADVNSLGDAMTAVFDRLKAQLLEIAFFGTNGKSGLFGGAFNSIASGFAGIFGGARASGGPVEAGKSYLVGEKGPEMFTPGASGSVMSNSATQRAAGKWGGDVVVHQTLNFPPDNAEMTERMVAIGAAMRDQAVSAMRQARNTGF